MADDDLAPALRLERRFGWGILLVMDQAAPATPELSGSIVSANASGLLVKVHHAADVALAGFKGDDLIPPAQVEVTVHVGREAPTEVTFRAPIAVPSGVLTWATRTTKTGSKCNQGCGTRWSTAVPRMAKPTACPSGSREVEGTLKGRPVIGMINGLAARPDGCMRLFGTGTGSR